MEGRPEKIRPAFVTMNNVKKGVAVLMRILINAEIQGLSQ